MARILSVTLVVFAALVAGVLLEHHYGLIDQADNAIPAVANTETALEHAARHLDPDYVCPMHPQVVQEARGSCPICGMDLVQVEHDSDDTGELPAVRIAPEVVHNLGVRTANAERRTLWRRIDTVGYVEYDRDKLRHVYPSDEGSIINLSVRSEGERVKKGQFLFELESPHVSKWFGEMRAQQDGIIAEIRVIEDAWVVPTDRIMTIGDITSVWVLADVFENQADWVSQGQSAEVRLPALAGRVWEGAVEYIYPNMDPETRTLKVRMRFDNADEILKPNMFTDVTIFGGPKYDVLAVPREALIETGKQQRVVVAEGGGRFQPRAVSVGVERGNWVEIIDGLDEGEQVVVSGQFLIDSESNLQASLSHFEGPEDHDESTAQD